MEREQSRVDGVEAQPGVVTDARGSWIDPGEGELASVLSKPIEIGRAESFRGDLGSGGGGLGFRRAYLPLQISQSRHDLYRQPVRGVKETYDPLSADPFAEILLPAQQVLRLAQGEGQRQVFRGKEKEAWHARVDRRLVLSFGEGDLQAGRRAAEEMADQADEDVALRSRPSG